MHANKPPTQRRRRGQREVLCAAQAGAHPGEEVGNDTIEEGQVWGQELGHVDVAKASQHEDVFGVVREGAFEVAARSDRGLDSAHAVVVVVLRGQLLGAELEGGDHLLGEVLRAQGAESAEGLSQTLSQELSQGQERVSARV